MKKYIWFFALLVGLGSYQWMSHGGSDWQNDIGPGIRHLETPWQEGLVLPPYMAVLLSPLGLVSDRLGTALLNTISVLLLALVIKKFNGSQWLTIPLLLSPPGYWLFKNGQTDIICLSGVLFGGWGVPLLLAKPQVALLVCLPLFRQKGWKFFIPGIAVVGLSLMVWPLWILRMKEVVPTQTLVEGGWNLSLFPYSIPFGLLLLGLAWKFKDFRWGIVASPLLSPYVNMPSYLGALTVLATIKPKIAVAVWLLIWGSGVLFLVI
jgi:hypothetical protein